MAKRQAIFRLDSELAGRLDRALRVMGFRTRDEWFRLRVQQALEEAQRREPLACFRGFTVPGMTEGRAVAMVRRWRRTGGLGELATPDDPSRLYEPPRDSP